MQKQAPSFGRIMTMVLFALSCFGLLLFLWLAFGGSTPLKPQGYRFHVTFPESSQLAQEADVRISGVSVGKVRKVVPAHNGTTDATVELDAPYAPLPRDARATLRQKTLLGEIYLELTPGSPNAPKIPENGRLGLAQVAPTVQLDEILRAFDPKTRLAFQEWVQTTAVALHGRGRSFSDALGTLPAFESNTDDLLKILNSQQGAVTRLVRNTGVVFNALSERTGQLSGFIRNANTVFATTAERNQQLKETFQALPTFEKESVLTLARLSTFAVDTNPLVTQLQPVAQQLTPTLQALQALAPTLKATFTNLDPVITNSGKGLPAVNSSLVSLQKVLPAFGPPLQQLTPVLYGLSFYNPELTAFFANSTAATGAVAGPAGGGNTRLHYLRTVNPLNPEDLAGLQQRPPSNRSSPYTYPGAFKLLNTQTTAGLKTYTDCTKNSATLGIGNDYTGPAGLNPVPPLQYPDKPNRIFNQLVQQAFVGGLHPDDPVGAATGKYVVAPNCSQQPQFPSLPGAPTATFTYPHITEFPPVTR